MSQIALLRQTPRTARTGPLGRLDGLRAMLDSVEANIFAADENFTLIYANRRALRTARSIEHSLRDAFGIGADDLVGGSIHRFHRDPSRVERILRDPANFPHEAIFEFGETTLRTTVNGIFGPAGELHGFIVSWDDVSERQRIEQLVAQVASELAGAATQTSVSSSELRGIAEETAGQAATTASAAEEMTASVTEIARTTASTVDLAREAAAAAAMSDSSMEKLHTSAEEIGGIVDMITKIAEQTNLLALNATIEAARAGEAGRGFSVVASEIKELSRETTAATAKIAQMITAIQAGTGEVTSAIDRVTTLVEQVGSEQTTVAAAIEEQTVTTAEIGRSVTTVAGLAERTTGAVDELQQVAAQLNAKAEELHELLVQH